MAENRPFNGRPAISIASAILIAIAMPVQADAWDPFKDLLTNSQRAIKRLEQKPPRPPKDALSSRELDYSTRRKKAPFFLAPWAAALVDSRVAEDLKTQGKSIFCNATLIRKNWAVTSPSCVQNQDPAYIELRQGSSEISESQKYRLSGVFIHPEFRPDSLENSIALIRLAVPVNSGDFAVVPTQVSDATPSGQVFGWGSIAEFESLISSSLIQVDTMRIDRQLCNSPTYYAGAVSQDMFCAVAVQEGIDTCLGFGGAGLISWVDGYQALLGIVSWGEGCGRLNKPTVYTDVAYFREWIQDVIRKNPD
ncbi:serine protease [Ensifer aridi]|uniref:serine protease n=1 Tax=Ensifer aridi TaxID=1708715 RepID=UPI00358FF289